MRFNGFIKNATPSINAYLKNNLSVFGRPFSKTINSNLCWGPPVTRAIDIQTDFLGLVVQSGVEQVTDNGRKFVLGTFTAGVASIALYTFNFATGAYVPVGRILITLPNQGASVHTPRYIRVLDAGTTNWRIAVGTIAATTVVNGGSFIVNKVNLSDFSFNPSPTQFFMQVNSDDKGVYMAQDPTLVGAAHAMTTLIGGGYEPSGTQLITMKGSAAAPSFDAFDLSLAPTVIDRVTTAATTSGSPTFTMTGHGFVANDMYVIKANAPTGFTISNGLNIQTVYFIRATNLTANTFELSATPGGAAINATSVTSGTVFVRAFGTVTNMYVPARKMSIAASGFLGTALLLDSCKIVTIADGPNAGLRCFFVPTTTNFYCFPLTSIASGNTSIAGAASINNSGTGTDFTAITTVAATYSEVLGKVIYTTAAFGFFMKSWVNSQISHAFGTQIGTWLENTGRTQDYFRGFAVNGLEVSNGWIFCTITTAGQRVILAIDARSDESFDFSYMISPVKDLGGVSVAKFVASVEELFEVTDNVSIEVRSSNSASDVLFDSPNGGWVSIPTNADLSLINLLRYAQIRIKWSILTFLSGIPAQIHEVNIGFEPLFESSMNFKGMATGSTDLRTVYRQVALIGSTPTLYHRGFNDNSDLVESFNSLAHAAQFKHSLDEGVTWLSGTGPDQVGKRIAFDRTTPLNEIITNSLRES